MTTYGEYAMKHPLVKLDENAFYHEITPKAYKILELHKQIPQDIKDEFGWKDYTRAKVTLDGSDNIIIESSVGNRESRFMTNVTMGPNYDARMAYVNFKTGKKVVLDSHRHNDKNKTVRGIDQMLKIGVGQLRYQMKPIAFTQEQIEAFVSDLGQNQPQLWRK